MLLNKKLLKKKSPYAPDIKLICFYTLKLFHFMNPGYPERHIFASCEIKTKTVLRYPPKGICLPYFSKHQKPHKETRSYQINDSDLWAEGHLYFPSGHMELRQVRKCTKDALVLICEFMLGYRNLKRSLRGLL